MRLLLIDIMILEEGFRLQFFEFMSIILANLKIYIEDVGKKYAEYIGYIIFFAIDMCRVE